VEMKIKVGLLWVVKGPNVSLSNIKIKLTISSPDHFGVFYS